MRGKHQLLSLLAASALLGGCFVDSTDPVDVVELSLSLNPPGTGMVATGSTFNPWDSQGVFLLEKWSKYVRVSVEHEDGYELPPIQEPSKKSGSCALCYPASWPSPAAGIGSGEGEFGEVDVALRLPAGNKRRLRALAYLVETGKSRVLVYKEDTVKTKAGKTVQTMDLTAGTELDLRVSMTMHPAGKAAVTVRCKAGAGADNYAPTSLAVRDARAQVQHPFLALTKSTGSYSAVVSGVPVGRPHYTLIKLKHVSDTSKELTVTVMKPSFSVAIANDTLAVNLDISCQL